MFCILSILGVSRAVKSKQPLRLALLLSILPLILQLALIVAPASVAEATTSYDESHYDPERETDGVPRIVGASRSLSQPLFKMTQSGDSEVEDSERVGNRQPGGRKNSLQKRSDDQEQEDDVDDEDRDEDKSGSSHHDSYESPAFGESRKAAQDGEDIERFFDTHLGPQEPAPAESSSSNHEATLPENDAADGSTAKLDSADDQYVAAASSPLSDIFHTLIKAHRRPIVIHATEEAPHGQTPAASNIANGGAHQQPDSTSVASASTDSAAPQLGFPMSHIDHPTPAGIIQAAATAAVAPLTLFAPMASHASPLPATGFEPHTEASSGTHTNGGEDQTTPVRVYIARRPSFIQHFRALAPAVASASSGHRLIQQSSDAHWRGLQAPRYVQMGADQRPPQYAESQDYSRYPVMANSYSSQRDYMPRDPAQSSPATDDESGTASYNLSFGSSSAISPEDDSPSVAQGGESEASPVGNYRHQHMSSNVHHQGYHPEVYANQQQSYGSGYSPNVQQHYSSSRARHPSSTQAYDNYYQQPAGFSPRPQRPGPVAQYQGARHHKDVSESGAQPMKFVQVYSNSKAMAASRAPMAQTTRNGQRNANNNNNRQKLLASLDEEIKSSTYYRQDATSPAQLYAQRSAVNLHKKSKSQLNQDPDADLVSYSSFHSETDPHKSFTASSELVTEPEPDNSMRRGSHKAPSTNNESAETRNESTQSHVSQTSDSSNTNKVVSTTKDQQQQQRQSNEAQDAPAGQRNLATGPLTKDSAELNRLQQAASNGNAVLLRYSPQQANHHRRVRRDDAEEREAEDADDDGVWVDDDEDNDDNRQTASDLSATTQEPLEDDEETVDGATTGSNNQLNGIVGGPHSYELANDR